MRELEANSKINSDQAEGETMEDDRMHNFHRPFELNEKRPHDQIGSDGPREIEQIELR